MNAFDTIVYHKVQGIANISLNRPNVLNAYNIRMRDDLYQVLEAVRDDPEVQVVILSGEGRAFCPGADITEFGTAPSQVVARQVRWERDVWGLMLDIPKPIIAAIHGYCLGSGVEIALLCDLRVASEDAVFGMPEVGLGMLPAAGGTQTLPRVLGVPRSLDFLLTGRRLSATEALEIGLVGRVVAKEALDEHVQKLAQALLSLPQATLRAAKEAVRRGMDLSLHEGLELEARLALEIIQARRGAILQ